ncbi:hypothetical protein ACQKL5_04900 [Peribacillus sp. NPDC097675]|uniref:hypothetical protein n=1 Tax=Peribacillus sp. NPDC097675 TaxID=3390618 RepID=UPI003CFE4BC5
MFRKIKGVAACLLFFALFFPIHTIQAKAADPDIKISFETGFDGYIARYKAMPMTVHIENKGEAFSGTLIFQFKSDYEFGGSQILKVELPKESKKTYSLSLPGYSDENYSYNGTAMTKTIYLYEGDLKNGKEVAYSGPKVLTPKFFDESKALIGVLSEKYDRLTELRILPSLQATLIELKKEELPKQSMGYEMFDYLIVDEFAIAALNEAQQKALESWVQSGGVLISGASPNGAQSYGFLYNLLPMKMDKEIKMDSSFLTEKKKDRPSFEQLPGFIGEVEKGAEIIAKSGESPAVVKKQYGNGMIIQTAFSLGDEPLASWEGYGPWFEAMINKVELNAFSTTREFMGGARWDMNEPNSYFDDTTLSVTQFLLLLIVYIVIIVPILFLVLKKMDKREHAWWVIPSIACITTVLTFAVGAKDRLAKPQLNQLGIYQVEDNQIVGIQSNVLLSNKGGDYNLSFPKNELVAMPMTQEGGGDSLKRAPMLEEKATDTVLTFPNVEYWSTRSFIGKVHKENTGQFKTDLTVENKTLTGTIQNETPYDFKELMIMSGNEKINLGTLKKGERVKVNEKVKTDFLFKPYGTTSSSWNNGTTRKKIDLEKMRREQLLYLTESYFLKGLTKSDPVIGGITDDEIVDVTLPKNPKENIDNLIFQTFNAKTIFAGEVTLTKEMFKSSVNVLRGSVGEEEGFGTYWFDKGEYEYISSIPQLMKDKTFKTEEMTIKFNKQNVKYELYNFSTGRYEPIADEEREITFKGRKDIFDHISKEGDIHIKVIKDNDDEPSIKGPQINVKGVVEK